MQVPVAVEKVPGNGYRARGGEPFAFSADGKTQQEALANLRAKIAEHLAKGVQILALEVPVAEHPLARFVGIYDPNDPLVKDWLQIMAETRKKEDAVLDLL
jgi:hypothetical protein